jgi:hypothetical protein
MFGVRCMIWHGWPDERTSETVSFLGHGSARERKSASEKLLTMQGTCTNPSIGSHVKPKLCSVVSVKQEIRQIRITPTDSYFCGLSGGKNNIRSPVNLRDSERTWRTVSGEAS